MKAAQLKLFSAPVLRIPPGVAKRWFDRMRQAVNDAPEAMQLGPDCAPDVFKRKK